MLNSPSGGVETSRALWIADDMKHRVYRRERPSSRTLAKRPETRGGDTTTQTCGTPGIFSHEVGEAKCYRLRQPPHPGRSRGRAQG